MIFAPSTDRRRLIRLAAAAISGWPLRALAAQPVAPADAGFERLAQIPAGELCIEYAELGPPSGYPVILLHGWPYSIDAFAVVAPRLARAGHRVIVPHLRGFGGTRFRSSETARNGQQSVLAIDTVALMNALDLPRAILAGFDWGARTANIVAALWPERVTAMVSVSGYLIGSQTIGAAPLLPEAERDWWYQYYFATERGRAGYAKNREAFARLIWRTASPRWNFDEATLARSVSVLANPDHVAVVIDNYRWRLGLSRGEARFDDYEQSLRAGPVITVPTVTLEGDANGAPHTDPASYAAKFTGLHVHRNISGGVGHNLPQEAPRAFTDAVLEAAGLSKR